MSTGVILYGPPASGKDTVTAALAGIDVRYRPFARLKTGRGRTGSYRMTTTEHIEQLRQSGQIVWENERYGATYATDRPALDAELAVGWPVLHVGQVEAVDAITTAMPDTAWTIAYLWCPRDVAAERIAARGTGDVYQRLQAWDETKPLDRAHVFVNTVELSPVDAGGLIHRAVVHSRRRHE